MDIRRREKRSRARTPTPSLESHEHAANGLWCVIELRVELVIDCVVPARVAGVS